jgi:hypothetical protein
MAIITQQQYYCGYSVQMLPQTNTSCLTTCHSLEEYRFSIDLQYQVAKGESLPLPIGRELPLMGAMILHGQPTISTQQATF